MSFFLPIFALAKGKRTSPCCSAQGGSLETQNLQIMSLYRVVGGPSAPFRVTYFDTYLQALRHAMLTCPYDYRLEQFDPVAFGVDPFTPKPSDWAVVVDFLTSKTSCYV